MECTWHELVVGLEEEPALSLAMVESESDHAVESVFLVAPDGVVEPVPVLGGFAPASSDVVYWDKLEILARNDGEGRLDIIGDEQFYELLVLRAKDEAEMAKQAAAKGGAPDGAGAGAAGGGAAAAPTADVDDITGAAIPVHDEVTGERVMAYDPNNPCMKAGTVYPNMKEFRLAIRQFAINKEFELKLVKTDPERYIGGCKVKGCPWHIVGHKQPNQKTVMVSVLTDFHTCTSSNRRRTTTPTGK